MTLKQRAVQEAAAIVAALVVLLEESSGAKSGYSRQLRQVVVDLVGAEPTTDSWFADASREHGAEIRSRLKLVDPR